MAKEWFLNKDGLTHYDEKIKEYINTHSSPDAQRIIQATCSTAAATQNKAITLPSGVTVANGDILSVKFTNTNSFSYSSTATPVWKVGSVDYTVCAYQDGTLPTGTNTSTFGTAARNIYYTVDVTNKKLYWFGKNWDNDSDTKTQSGTSNKVGTKMFLVGGTSQATNTTTYSNVNCYVGTDNELYSNGKKVAHAEDNITYTFTQDTTDGHKITLTPSTGTATTLTIPDSDTKNTTGTTNKVGTKMFLAGATSQAANPQTYSNVNVYVGTDNELYSNGKKVAHAEDATYRLVEATCNTAAAEQKKVITLPSGVTLKNGDRLKVTFSYTNTYNSTADNHITFLIGSDTYEIKYRNDSAYATGANTSLYGIALYSITYVVNTTDKILTYENKNWDNNTTYTNASLGQGYGTCTTAASTAAKVVSLGSYSLTTGGVVSVKFTNAVPANATMNINSKGAKEIWYLGAKIKAGIIQAGDLAIFMYDGTRYHLLNRDKTAVDSFTGTQAEVAAAIKAGTITSGMTVYITDDITNGGPNKLDTIEEIAAAKAGGDDLTKYAAGAMAVNTLSESLNAFQFRTQDGKPQWKLESAGADSWAFFSSSDYSKDNLKQLLLNSIWVDQASGGLPTNPLSGWGNRGGKTLYYAPEDLNITVTIKNGAWSNDGGYIGYGVDNITFVSYSYNQTKTVTFSVKKGDYFWLGCVVRYGSCSVTDVSFG